MKTLSIQQPWASLICAGIKDVENRTWKAAKVPGRILIHASSKKVSRNFLNTIPEEMESYISNNVFFGNIAPLNELPTSAIIGYVTVTGFDDGEVDSVWADGQCFQILLGAEIIPVDGSALGILDGGLPPQPSLVHTILLLLKQAVARVARGTPRQIRIMAFSALNQNFFPFFFAYFINNVYLCT